MSLHTTPLQLGYFFALLMWIVFWIRSIREQRLSDAFIGSLLLLLALEIQDYTFGFAGINFLWEELNGFPRDFSLLIGPCFYFYIQSQTNSQFQLKRKQALHLVPFTLYFALYLSVFTQGAYAVQEHQQSTIAESIEVSLWLITLASFVYYFIQSIQLYKKYQIWSRDHFSNTEYINFKWFRNFIYILITCFVAKGIFQVLDFTLQLDYNQDWYWNLVIVASIFYIGLTAYSQRQGNLLEFKISEPLVLAKKENKVREPSEEYSLLLQKLNRIMAEDRLYLQPELNLAELAKHLHSNTNQLSACINQEMNANFNDYVNGLRIAAFTKNATLPEYKNYTLLAMAFDCGFNSKSTFNRAFKKLKGITPNQYLKELKS